MSAHVERHDAATYHRVTPEISKSNTQPGCWSCYRYNSCDWVPYNNNRASTNVRVSIVTTDRTVSSLFLWTPTPFSSLNSLLSNWVTHCRHMVSVCLETIFGDSSFCRVYRSLDQIIPNLITHSSQTQGVITCNQWQEA